MRKIKRKMLAIHFGSTDLPARRGSRAMDNEQCHWAHRPVGLQRRGLVAEAPVHLFHRNIIIKRY